ncbi:hypothetical protein [Cupriavidus sp. CuC1]|uniref:hypothetical protein n=1 Tax=Cupriavidus sp. CuC1 TaxID=3373131 RepID=UPI0037CFC79C
MTDTLNSDSPQASALLPEESGQVTACHTSVAGAVPAPLDAGLPDQGRLDTPSSGLLDLSRQQCNLLLLRPLFALELNKGRVGSESTGDAGLLASVDTHYLVLSVLDFMMEGTTMNMGCTQDEVLRHLAAAAQEMKPGLSATQYARVAEVVMDTLDNKANAYREFSYEFFNAAQKSVKTARFRLVTYEPDLEDVYRYRPTSEGYLVYLGMLDLSPEDSQVLMEKMLDLLVQRGRFEAALEIAKRARKLSIEYRQLIRDRLTQAYRAPGSVNWTKEVAEKLGAARTHVRGRQNEDQRMEEAVRAALVSAEDFESRQHLSQLLKTVQSAGLVRSNLVNDITVAPEKFLESQRAVFRARRPSGLPDLETHLFPGLLGLPANVLTDNADHCISGLYPPVWPKVYDLNATFSLLLERRAEDTPPEEDDGDIAPHEPPPDQFSKALIATVVNWLTQRFSTGKSYYLDELLGQAKEDGLDTAMCHCMALVLMRSFAQSESLFPHMRSDASGRFSLDIAQGTNLMVMPAGEE